MVSEMLYYYIVCVALLMDLLVLCVSCLPVFVNCLVKQFAICLGVVVILLLNVMEVFSVCRGALLDRPCMVFQRSAKQQLLVEMYSEQRCDILCIQETHTVAEISTTQNQRHALGSRKSS